MIALPSSPAGDDRCALFLALRLRTIVIRGDPRRIGTVAAALLAWVAGATAAHELAGRPVFVLATLGGALLVSLLLDWRVLLASSIFLVLVEALPRRYLVNDVALFFVKDMALAVAYAKYVIERRRAGRPLLPRTPLLPAIGALAALVVLEVANPYLPALAVGAVGLHGWLWYVPIVFLVPEAVASPARAVAWVRTFALVSLPLAVLAALQIRHPVLNANYYDDIYGPSSYSIPNGAVGDRSVSSFASTGAYADYVTFTVVAAFALAAAAPRARRTLLLVALFGGFLLAIGGAATRGVVAALFVSVVVFGLLTLRLDRRLLLLTGLTCALVASSFVLYPQLPGLHRAVVSGLSPTSIGNRIRQYVGEPMPAPPGGGAVRSAAGPGTPSLAAGQHLAAGSEPVRISNLTTRLIGHGTGVGAPGRQYLAPFLNERQLREATVLAGPEGGWLNVTWEFGLLGALVLLGVFATIARTARAVYRQAGDDDRRILGALGFLLVGTTAALMFLSTKIGQVNYTIFFWAGVGLMLAGSRPRRHGSP